ncbi:MAG TPA: hypothetical protein DCS13_02425 [Candidatus Margulisbacteria bacterium]|nr:MAG: hypothetical protein A2X43_09205 [Candidatus Margulisbacteria bacterium GWD2_39_127]HAR62297.1 hypothetical protein [Candidatus Margulisiibacteriota bacterium]
MNAYVNRKIVACPEPILPADVLALIKERAKLVDEIIVPGGPLDQYLLKENVDPKSATVYFYGSSCTGVPFLQKKSGVAYVTAQSDIDFLVFANKVNGTLWRMPEGPNRPFEYNSVPVEVISGYVQGSVLDEFLFNLFGLKIYSKEATLAVPFSSKLVRSPSPPD